MIIIIVRLQNQSFLQSCQWRESQSEGIQRGLLRAAEDGVLAGEVVFFLPRPLVEEGGACAGPESSAGGPAAGDGEPI